MINDRLKRVIIGRDDCVPVEDVKNWYLFIKNDGTWDAGQHNDDGFINILKDKNTKNIFCVWHGKRRTNLFLMNKEKLIKKIKKMKNDTT